MAEDGLEQMRTAVTARFGPSQGSFAEVDLQVPSGRRLHSSKDTGTLRLLLSTEALDRVVGSPETLLEDQVLPDPLGLQSLLEFLLDLLRKGSQ